MLSFVMVGMVCGPDRQIICIIISWEFIIKQTVIKRVEIIAFIV
jgi:hypothetical protein